VSYHAAGFTPDEEKTLLTSSASQGTAVAELTAWTQRQDTIRNITIISIVGGLIYTLARMGDLVAQMRARRRGQPEE
jgi:hypothetical protein